MAVTPPFPDPNFKVQSITSLATYKRVKRHRQLILAALACLSLFIRWHLSSLGNTADRISGSVGDVTSEFHLRCRDIHGANATLVILKTGSTELQERLPIHLSTTIRCYSNYMIFSDYEEDYQGEHIIDALEPVHPDILANHEDFALHRRLKQEGRVALTSSELSGSDSEAIQWHGKVENPGWKLDKWKFLPMVNRTFYEYPQMKWYVFVEADTFIFWASLQQYLAVLDHTHPHYTGSQMYIGDVVFAHGGSGFIVSQSAMRLVVKHYSAHQAELEAFTDGHWAGDCVLGKAFKEAGVPFTDAWPIMQGDYPGIVPYARLDGRPVADESKRVWCYPTVSYHHVSPVVVEDIWDFEQQWLASKTKNETNFLRHKDVFKRYVLPRMSALQVDWDNESDDDEGSVGSIEACRDRCEALADCKQFTLDDDGHCKTRTDPRLGKAAQGVRSGWIQDRMLQFERDMAPCGDENWMV